MNIRLGFLGACIATMLTSGCAKYKPQPLGIPGVEAQEKNGLVVRAELLQDQADEYFFGGLSPKKAGYETIHLSIMNKTNQTFLLDANKIDMEIAPVEVVAKKIKFNTAARVLGWGIPGIFLWPFLIPAFVDGIGSSNANDAIEADFDSRAISGSSRINIQPNTALNKFMFVKAEDLELTFNLKLVNKASGVAERFSINL
jgi:hypothetical protein